jgi:hypothetical protein
MKRIILTTLALASFLISNAQWIDNKLNIYLEFNRGSYYGKEMANEDNFICPSLYANYKNLYGYSLKGLAKAGQFCSVGLEVNYSNASNWELEGYSDYSSSTIEGYSLSPKFQIHTRFKETGLFNKIRFLIEVGPEIGISELYLVNSIFDIQGKYQDITQPMNVNNPYFGVKGSAGFEMTINNLIGLSVTYTRQYEWVESKFYQDKNISDSRFDIGIFFRFKKNKRLFY